MLTMFAQLTIAGIPLKVAAASLVIAFFIVVGILARRGAQSSRLPSETETWSPRKPSIEVSEKNSTASITVQVNPHRPVVYTVEPLNGAERLVSLTVVYEQSLDALESAILKSAASASGSPQILTDVDDPAWLEKVRRTRGGDPR